MMLETIIITAITIVGVLGVIGAGIFGWNLATIMEDKVEKIKRGEE